MFGGIRSTVDAAGATADAREADLQDVLISLTADVALNYIDIRSLRRRVELARSNVNLQQETLELTQFRAQAGLATDLDVQQALANVETTRAQIASLESRSNNQSTQWPFFSGRPPAELNAEFTRRLPSLRHRSRPRSACLLTRSAVGPTCVAQNDSSLRRPHR